tara:strand:- start:6158 stop:6529 length:372 start_codon:yes stop_codon:yes gene_type:complete
MWLTFDWDDIEPNHIKVKEAFIKLNEIFGHGNVWHRVSSSGTGLHLVIGTASFNKKTASIIISPIDFSDDEVFNYRTMFSSSAWELECNGRLITDGLRRQAGTTWGRIFTVKNGNVSGEWSPC